MSRGGREHAEARARARAEREGIPYDADDGSAEPAPKQGLWAKLTGSGRPAAGSADGADGADGVDEADEASPDPEGAVVSVPDPEGDLDDSGWPVSPTERASYPAAGPNAPAAFTSRALARTLDAILSVWLPLGLVNSIVFAYAVEEVSSDVEAGTVEYDITNVPLLIACILVSVSIPFLYEWFFLSRWGRTPGKMGSKLRVASIEDGAPPTGRQSAKRAALPGFIILLFPLLAIAVGPTALFLYPAVFLSGLLDAELTRDWPDRLAGTVVVRTR